MERFVRWSKGTDGYRRPGTYDRKRSAVFCSLGATNATLTVVLETDDVVAPSTFTLHIIVTSFPNNLHTSQLRETSQLFQLHRIHLSTLSLSLETFHFHKRTFAGRASCRKAYICLPRRPHHPKISRSCPSSGLLNSLILCELYLFESAEVLDYSKRRSRAKQSIVDRVQQYVPNNNNIRKAVSEPWIIAQVGPFPKRGGR